jgi:O-antigen/teichoic acid export membrane protein
VNRGIESKVIKSLKWSLIGTVLSQFLKVIVTILLTRLLNAEDFGLLAVCLSVMAIGQMFSNFGLGSALIQKKNISDDDVRYVFTLQLILGGLMTAFIYFMSPYIAIFFDNQEIVELLQVLSFMFIVQALSMTSLNLLRRTFEFKKTKLIDIFSYTVSYLFVGLPCAYLGFGVWSLVYAQLMQVTLQTILLCIAKKHSYKLLLNHREGKGILSFGGKILMNNAIGWVINYANTFFIGHFLGIKTLGQFNRNLTLVSLPMDMVTTGFQGVLFSFYSKINENKDDLRQKYLVSLSVMSLIMFPIFFTISLVPEQVVGAVFGNKWVSYSEIIFPLALAMPVNSLLALAGPILWGSDRGMLEIKAQAHSLLYIVPILYILSQYSLMAASFGVLITFIIRLILINNKLFKFIDLKWLDFISAIYKPFILGIVISITVWAVNIIFVEYESSYVWGIFVSISIAMTSVLIVFNFFFKFVIGHTLHSFLIENYKSLPIMLSKKL